jgi:hypothetical protein
MPGEVRECRHGYFVSDDGRVFSSYSGKLKEVKPYTTKWGYKRIRLYGKQKNEDVFVHVLVLEAFVGPCPEGCEARHLDGSRDNNNINNLVWGTRSENSIDAIRDGSFVAKLTEDDVREVRELLAQGWTQTEIGKLFGVSQSQISLIKTGKEWRHVV